MDKMQEGIFDTLKIDAKKVQAMQKQELAKKARDLAKASTGVLSPARKIAKEKYKLATKAIQMMREPKTDDEILKIAGLSESSNFIDYLVKNAKITKDKAEKVWEDAKKAFNDNPEYKNKSEEDKYKIIAGIAKKMVGLNEDGEIAGLSVGPAVPQTAGSALNTTSSIGGLFAAKIGEYPNYDKPYKANPKNIFTRYSSYGDKKKRKKLRKEHVDLINNYIDNLLN